MRNWLITWSPAFGIVILILFVWEVLVEIRDIPSWLLPTPSSVAMTIYSDYSLLTMHTLVTLEEIVLGFFLALIVGVLFASAICLSNTFEKALYPFIIASQTVPIIVIAPMLLVWIGYGLAPKVIVVALISFFPIVVNMVDGMKAVDPDIQKLMYTLGGKKSQVFSKVMIPSSLPYLFSGLRVAIAMSVIGAVIGEWVGSSEGLGYLMIRSKPQFQTERVFAAIAILSFIGVALFCLITYLEKILVPWSIERRVLN